MLEPPDLAEEKIVAALQEAYGARAAALTFLPLGSDSASWVYRVDSASDTHLLKLRLGIDDAALLVPRYLQGLGVPHLVAPVATLDEKSAADVDGFTLILYPFIDGEPGSDGGLSAAQWRALGGAIKQVHTAPLVADLRRTVRRETFTPSRRHIVVELQGLSGSQTPADDVARELTAFWEARRDEIQTLVDRADALGHQLAHISSQFVLCHADLHTWNVLVDTEQRLWIVDWDETILAPKERDLMFVVGGIGHGLVSADDTASFLDGYGETAIDPLALAYYRYAWAVQDLGAYAERALLLHGVGEKTRRAAVRGLKALFEPGNIIEIARAHDESVV